MADELDKIKKIINGDQDNIKLEINYGMMGLNMDQTLNQIKDGTLTYALNAALENFDSSSVNYQNEQGNEFCLQFPEGYSLIGTYFINEKNKIWKLNANTFAIVYKSLVRSILEYSSILYPESVILTLKCWNQFKIKV